MEFRSRPKDLFLLLGVLGGALPACVEGPENGDLYSHPTHSQGFGVTFEGKYDKPNKTIRIQVQKSPDNPNDQSWVTIGTTTTSSTPEYWNQAEPYYSWSIGAIPAPNAATAERWPQGGILRFRAVNDNASRLATFDQDRYECFLDNAADGWISIGHACQSSFPVAAIVSVSPTPADLASTPKYLTFKTQDCNAAAGECPSTTETQQYYEATNAPENLTAFKQEYGFGLPGTDEVTATFFNEGDLGVGREMHCKSFQKAGMASPGRVCYVSNYGDGRVKFGADKYDAVARAIAGTQSVSHFGAFATVAMAYYPPIEEDNSVRFVVFDEYQNLTDKAQLDSKGYNIGVPQNCIMCHGGGTYDAGKNLIVGARAEENENGARFLPFDVSALYFSTTAGYTLSAQQEAIRKLNQHVYNASPSQATKELIEGWYAAGSVDTPGTAADPSFVPATFAVTAADKKVYQTVVAPYCRNCHAAQTGTFSFTRAADFQALAPMIDYRTCTLNPDPGKSHMMPNAEVTLKRFWKSPARAYLAGYLNTHGSCKP
jgi:hypothetical protein